MKNLNWQKILHDTYVELYKNSEPKADFDELAESASINNRGEKIIPFLNYEIDPEVMDAIVSSFEKKYRMTKRNSDGYRFAIYLGCSPKTKS